MIIEVEPTMEYGNGFIISAILDDQGGFEASMGVKKFIETGKFQYEWLMEYLTVDDLQAISEAIAFIIKQKGAEQND